MGDEADADWLDGLVEAGIEECENYFRDRRASSKKTRHKSNKIEESMARKSKKPQVMPAFQSHEERDAYFAKHADYFTLVKKTGVGTYDRTECKSLEEAVKLAQTRQVIGSGGWMIYAVIGQQSAFIKAIPPTGK